MEAETLIYAAASAIIIENVNVRAIDTFFCFQDM